MRELFLRQASGLPRGPQIVREYLPNLHHRQIGDLMSISPRSILYKSDAEVFASDVQAFGVVPGDYAWLTIRSRSRRVEHGLLWNAARHGIVLLQKSARSRPGRGEGM